MRNSTLLSLAVAAALAVTASTSMAASVQTVTVADSRIELPVALSPARADVPVQAAQWSALADPALPDLIQRALVANTDIRQASARLKMARFQQRATDNNALPQGDLQMSRAGGDSAPSAYSAGLSLAWEIDLFGRLADQRRGASARYSATEADLRGVQVAIAAEVARTWFQLRGAREAATAFERYVQAQADVVKVTTVLVENGKSAAADLARSRAEAASDAAEAQLAHDRVFALEARLAVLLGEVAGSWHAPASPTLAQLHLLPVELPDVAALLAARPDVQAAARRLEASGHDAGAASAARFPRVSLFGVLSFFAGDLGSLFSASSNTQGGALSWSPLALPRLQSEYRAAQAGTELSLAQYDGVVLRAIEDAETALQRHGSANSQLQLRVEAAQQSQVAAEAAQARFEEGAAPYLESLLGRRDAIRAELAAIDALVGQRAAVVDVLRALGTTPADPVGAGSAFLARKWGSP